MKKTVLLLIAVTLSISSYAQFRAGLGLTFATDISTAGIELTGVYEITDQWEGAAAFTFFFKKDNVSWKVLDLEGHYIFHSMDKFDFFGVAGLSFNFWKMKFPESNFGGIIIPESTESGTEVGFNIGAGAKYNLSEQLSIVPELKVTLMDGSYVRFGVTAQYKF